MLRLVLRVATLVFAIAVSTPESAFAVDLTSVGVEQSAALPKIKSNWPVPNDKNQVFYLQRSTNKNTIVYTVRFDANGNIDARTPVGVHWRRFNDSGEIKDLKRIEHVLYGIKARETRSAGEFNVSLRRLPQIPMLLRQTGPGEAQIWVRIGGKVVQPIYAFANVDHSGVIDRLTSFTVVGRDPATGSYLSETYSVSGGGIRP